MTSNDSAKENLTPPLQTIRDYINTYAASLEGNDQKAVKVFCQFETQEKLRRFQRELIMIKDGGVSDTTCDNIIGKKRKAKHRGYETWASLMLQWISSKKKL